MFSSHVDRVRDYKNELEFLYPNNKRLIGALAMSTLTGQDLMVVGPPGVGKSRMLHEFSKIYPPIGTFRYGCQSQTTSGHLLGFSVVKDRLEGGDTIKPDKICIANLAILEEAGDLPTDVIRDAMLPAADTPDRKVQIGQYSFKPQILDRLHAIWYTSNFNRQDPGLEAWIDRTLFQFAAERVKDSRLRNAILLRQNIKIDSEGHALSENELRSLRKITDPNDTTVIVPYWLLKVGDQILLNLCDKWDVSDACRPAPGSIRAMFQAIILTKAHALMNGRNVANIEDLGALIYFSRLTEETTSAESKILSEIRDIVKYLQTENGRNITQLADLVIASERILLLEKGFRQYNARFMIPSLLLPECFKSRLDSIITPKELSNLLQGLKQTNDCHLEDRKLAVISALKDYGNYHFMVYLSGQKIVYYQE